MQCKQCKKQVIKKYPVNNKKYCSTKCSKKAHQDRSIKWLRQKKLKEASIESPDKMQCQICGLWYRKVGSHIRMSHNMTAREYRKEYGFDVKKGQLTAVVREPLRKNVFSNGTVNNLKKGEPSRFKKGQAGVGIYERSAETMDRLKVLHTLTKKYKKPIN